MLVNGSKSRHAKVSEWIKEEFGDAGPSAKTVVRAIKDGKIPGIQIRGCWYVNRLEFEKSLQKSTNPLVNMVMKGRK